ncbi:phosphate ABC transporter ATP-binding protein [Metaclostridioides mangenotii]|uniref:Phosphate transport system ATP-binding protein n=1 Tax=Metaclostridioides mangenotii TaxID=1540 RepID=A0ABS4EES5_9FIRM|nr:ATP-binding cassette domain-containing protein [Clostridioides mangenotii]MBP1856439.1 phosphate transport system ATP-binding protein [Clostridioides mangenotii]
MNIEIEQLGVGYGEKQILSDVSLYIPTKKITAVVGQSGCGKSTLLKSINRIIEEDGGKIEGKILLDGRDTSDIPKEELRKNIGLVFQQPIVFPYSIEKNITYVLNYHFNISKQEVQKRTQYYLEVAKLYDEVKANLMMPANRLSGGQQQRLAIARSLCVEPEVLLLDEPCSALDMKNTIAIENMLLELKDDYSIVIVTHNLAQAKRIADQVVFMEKGKIIEVSDKEMFFEEPKTDLAREYIKYM